MYKIGMLQSGGGTGPKRGFITEWTLTATTGKTVTIPTSSVAGLVYNAVINWGDGSSSTCTGVSTGNSHTYADYGVYEVEITGTFDGFSFYLKPIADKAKITNIIYWGDYEVFNGFCYLYRAFEQCANLKSFGEGRILRRADGPSFLASEQFYYMFSQAGSAVATTAAIPDELFNEFSGVISRGFSGVFSNCPLVKDVPAGLFNVHTELTDYAFYSAFQNCVNLETMPDYLFRYNTKVAYVGFQGMASGCPKLQLSPWMFYANGEQSTRFATTGSVGMFNSMFTRTTFTGNQGTAPDLWNCTFPVAIGNPRSYGGAGNSLVSISNYASIPANWK